MKEKERLIIEMAMKLFAAKGVNATSVQEIVTACGISKGAFYLYFKSKDELLLATLKYYYEKIQSKMMKIDKESLLPREKFVKQLYCQFHDIQTHKEFIIMHARENAIPFNKEVEAFMMNMKMESHAFYRNSILSIYGEKVTPYLLDLVVIVEGISRAYLELIILNETEINLNHVSTFILKRMDDIVEGLVNSGEEPVLHEEQLGQLLCSSDLIKEQVKEQFLQEIIMFKRNLADELENDELLVTLDVLEAEMRVANPRIPVIQGMLANLKRYDNLMDFRLRLAKYYEIDII
ncbi:MULTISPECIES: TetR/AcrR family transcriptional regulator [Bacillus cereus group]|uniref:Transcriptional regulator, TetR family n=1 Tax=Bacillus cytotoxicus (strain DSM 22905 / CIP 110041 / 391-98 / NVH 391-98) TaxID=315749 RepID=A7GVH8_BACCN|nr:MULTISPECIES: TetR/AcrR family transcriptional regulator [Bacillus cereus group]ABS24136.1 transcriptional regulator, TetR family [Bacillus cytotoxicus NVH 391-98]AWC34759.1 TetR/AcrR family transcriptional regulator [Bacillus cytotoxicus]AWC38754.1 TetR/AcrR family transcriptional regulator [Bacillus cytotoxicus]AWC46732.1 TetR/AcrR family transcriptional regulator [Bacillus cytotoxicus]AWC62972.1 TetR/AcrR family transcriptional regulator [Bacillus cytotoxicus]